MTKLLTLNSSGQQSEVDIAGAWTTYTPVLQASGGITSVTYANVSGKYLDIGKIRYFTAAFDTSNTVIVNLANDIRVSLPGLSANRVGDRTMSDAAIASSGLLSPPAYFGLILPNTSYAQLQSLTSAPLLYSVIGALNLLGSTKWFVKGFYELP